MRKKKKEHNKMVISTENIISKALKDNESGHEDFTTLWLTKAVMNEERNYRKLKENIKMMKSQRGNTKRANGKRWYKYGD